MKEIIFYGRGGQGAVIASRLLAVAAFKEGKYVQSFPFFGVERRGAPVTAYTRISDVIIRKRSPITEADYVVILDPTLIESIDTTKGLKAGGSIIINSKSPKGNFIFAKKYNTYTFDAAKIATGHKLGTEAAPIVNTAVLGAFSKFTKEIGLSSLLEAIGENVSVKSRDNQDAAKEAYEKAAQ
ncbi:MAG: 2-oxoacid:acceptor oxidoreductase family protein [Candidatus Omnitrophica bacterium]|nr:2-oxoacid:acceptor oxidoreductase family protein [Candidatus Omnitrophota bacterium]MBU4488860.1 2-oxoacid:acceptor oxidoreductase family protein [Candidatus Omnitrophota bacterium]MCG2705658.1 2-oxoacid:acceptor oxidoreductase family protein [Candidatus Omnitrophota bacterium]